MSSVTLPAFAKINLTLDVHARRPDGYHDIRSVMQTVALHDTLEITHTPEAPGVSLIVTGDEAAGVPADESNIVHRAAVRLQKTAAARNILPGNKSGLRITLTKRIPSQAGLGGGSSDAAATLCAVNTLFDLKLPLPRLTEIAATLGADVPFFLTGGTALVEGLGEKITPLPPLGTDWWVVIVKPPVGVSTAAAYAALDAAFGRVSANVTDAWLNGNGTAIGNDFQEVTFAAYPQIASAYSAMAEDGEAPPLLCGSGAAIFRLLPNEDSAHALASRLQATPVGKVWVTKSQGRTE